MALRRERSQVCVVSATGQRSFDRRGRGKPGKIFLGNGISKIGVSGVANFIATILRGRRNPAQRALADVFDQCAMGGLNGHHSEFKRFIFGHRGQSMKQHGAAIQAAAQQVNGRADQVRAFVIHRPEVGAAAAILRTDAHMNVDRPAMNESIAQRASNIAGAEDDDQVAGESGFEEFRIEQTQIAHAHIQRVDVGGRKTGLAEDFLLGGDHAREIILHDRRLIEKILHLPGQNRCAFSDGEDFVGDGCEGFDQGGVPGLIARKNSDFHAAIRCTKLA